MTLHEASAVFLIIGSVMMGPIESSVVIPSGINPRQVAIDRNVSYKKGVRCIHVDYSKRNPTDPGLASKTPIDCHLETTTETCTRAMREIGAKESTTVGHNSDGKRAWVLSGYWFVGSPHQAGPELGGYRVLCIPAPSGLVR